MGCPRTKVVEELALIIKDGFTNRAHKLLSHDTCPITVSTIFPNLPRGDEQLWRWRWEPLWAHWAATAPAAPFNIKKGIPLQGMPFFMAVAVGFEPTEGD